ncbi:hypothetical protein T484DRAFT_1972518 [Baffinella frigidus]|nr:hypothetical protein T484DRAFT_1972518 [Cryptophyta sp. CCMP2293]
MAPMRWAAALSLGSRVACGSRQSQLPIMRAALPALTAGNGRSFAPRSVEGMRWASYEASTSDSGTSAANKMAWKIRAIPDPMVVPASTCVVYFDGSVQGPDGHTVGGPAACGAIVKKDGKVLWKGAKFLGEGSTNNEAKWEGEKELHMASDNLIVVKQMTGEWPCRSEKMGVTVEWELLEKAGTNAEVAQLTGDAFTKQADVAF